MSALIAKMEELTQTQNEMKVMLVEMMAELRKHDPVKAEQIQNRNLRLIEGGK